MAHEDIFKQDKEKILVNTYAIDVFLPYEYIGSEYRGTSYYSVIGTQVKYFAIGNFRVYKSEKEFENPLTVPTYVLGIPMTILSKPSEIDTREVQFTKDGPLRKCVVLTFLKGDEFLSNCHSISTNNHVMMTLGRLEGGKMTAVPPSVMVQIVPDAEKMNNVNLRIPPEELEIYISERYRNPNNPAQKRRFADTVADDSDKSVSYRMREEAMETTTYQAITHEDINNALLTSVNRKRKGIINEPTLTEMITRGLDISDVAEKDDE